jgi:signal transduction histidine kinase
MDSLIGIVSLSLIFIVFLVVIYGFFKNNSFASNSSSKNSEIEAHQSGKLNKLARLKKENIELNDEIKFLEEKNRKLRFKISQMKEVIASLEEQKAQLEKSKNRLNELRVEKDETLAMVAHDIKNPASTIKNFVDLLESYDLSAHEQHEVFSGLIETSSRLVKLADEFTQVISEEHTPFHLKKAKYNLKNTVESIVKVNMVKANTKNIELRLYQPDTDLEGEFDEDKIKEVLDNFVDNAIKFCPKNCKVDVITKAENNYVTVEVTDNGYGLTEDEVTNAFEKGSKLSTKPTGDETSSGLGLWIAKKIVEEHNGRVYVKSKKGIGSTFSFKIPMK